MSANQQAHLSSSDVIDRITAAFANVHVAGAWGDTFLYYNPDPTQADEFYFASVKTQDDDYDNVSQLNRGDTFRLNLGIGKASFFARFPERPPRAGAEGIPASDVDYTATDTLLPHPVYGRQYWVCVINPSAATFAALQPLIAEAYAIAVEKYNKRAARHPASSSSQ